MSGCTLFHRRVISARPAGGLLPVVLSIVLIPYRVKLMTGVCTPFEEIQIMAYMKPYFPALLEQLCYGSGRQYGLNHT